MRLRELGTLVAVATALAVVVGVSPADAAASSTVRATVTDLDATGRPIGRPRPAHRSHRSHRSLQASGCREIDIYKEGKSFLFGAVVYRWHHTKRWCWSGGRVTGVWSSAFATNVDPNWYYRGIAASTSYFFNGKAVHYSMRQAKLENCILKFGCIGSEYPWVKIWAYGDGSYRWGRGT